jgi:hypothetical protein
MTVLAGELEVIRRTRMAQDDAVESAMVHELAEKLEAEAVRVHPGDDFEIVRGSRNPHHDIGHVPLLNDDR